MRTRSSRRSSQLPRRPHTWQVAVLASVFVIGMGTVMPGGGSRAQQSMGGLAPEALRQIQSLLEEKAARTPAQRKIHARLLYASRMLRGQAVAAGVTTLQPTILPEADGRVIVDVRASVSDGLLQALQQLGADVLSSSERFDNVRVQVALDQLEAIAARPDVRFIVPRIEAITQRRTDSAIPTAAEQDAARELRRLRRESVVASLRSALAARAAQDQTGPVTSVGSRNSQGDRTHLATVARGKWGVTGAGVKIGVLSDGVGGLALSQASGDLPTVTVLPGQAGSGAEGTAMLEIIHDLAPGAQLFFATAFSGINSFAQNVRDLRNISGCDIIVDDVFYFNEPPFQDGQNYNSELNGAVVTEAVKDVVASGALYFSSAGNSGNKNDNTSGTWEGNFIDGGPINAPPMVGQIHQFTVGQNFNVLSQGNGCCANVLFWTDPLGQSANDYDLFLLDSTGTTVLDASTALQNGTQDPWEIVNAGSANQRLVIVKFSGAQRYLHLDAIRARLSISTAGNIKGHSATTAANSFGVAATPAQFPGPFPNPFNAANAVETFSSDGPRRTFFNSAGGFLGSIGDYLSSGGIVLNKPDITAADGVSVTGNGGFPTTFFGTSAAAPHAGAIAALIKSRPGPALTPTQIANALRGTAVDIEGAGLDRDAGFGIVMAEAAIASVEHNFGPPAGNIVVNGDFSGVSGGQPTVWSRFATPDLTHMVSQVTAGVFEYYRVPNGANQAVIFQHTGVAYGPNAPLRAQFDIGNSDPQRKRISVLMVADTSFSDLAVCTFWLPPNAPLATYQMRSHTNRDWTNAGIYFYAASAGSIGGFYRLDNVSMQLNTGGPTTETECVDPLAPAPPGGAPGAELLVNGDFSSGIAAPWVPFGTIVSQVASAHSSVGGTNVFEFMRPTNTPPAGVVLQSTGQAMTANQIMTATFQLGNTSRVLKRVTVLLHDNDFSDLSACTFYLLPGQVLSTYTMKSYATEAWTNATLSIYAATIGTEQWIRLDNASFKRTPGTATFGTDCEEPAVTAFSQDSTSVSRPIEEATQPDSRDGLIGGGSERLSGLPWSSRLRGSSPGVLRLSAPLDLSDASDARLSFRSWLTAAASSGEVQVSDDGIDWKTIAVIAPSMTFEEAEVDLRDFSGSVIWLRFVLDRSGRDTDPPDIELWRIESLQLHRGAAASAVAQSGRRGIGRVDRRE